MSAIITCPLCQMTMWDSAEFCPGCGAPRTALRQRLEKASSDLGRPYDELLKQAKQDAGFSLELVTIGPDGTIHVRSSTIPEARLAIKILRNAKSELNSKKKIVAAQMAEIRSGRRMEVAQKGSKFRGGGDLGRLVRIGQTMQRDADRRRHAYALDPLDAEKADIDRRMLLIDMAITKLNQQILDLSK